VTVDDITPGMLLAALQRHSNSMTLENRTWFVELGQTFFSPEDFSAHAKLTVNGVLVGDVNIDDLQDEWVQQRK